MIASVSSMDVIHPGSKPLDADQLSLLETFRVKVDSRITNHGLTAADVQMFQGGLTQVCIFFVCIRLVSGNAHVFDSFELCF